MKQYRYKARESPTLVHEGRIQADSAEAAARSLSTRGWFPISVQAVGSDEAGEAAGFWGRWRHRFGRRRLGLADQALFIRQLGDLLAAGVPLVEALGLLHSQSDNPRIVRALAGLADKVRGGDSFSDALTEQGGVLPATHIGVIRAGEMSGALEAVIQGIADFLEDEAELVQKVRGAVTYPAIVAGASLVTVCFLFGYLIPKLSVLYLDLGQELPVPTRMLLAMADGFVRFGLPVLGALLLVALLVARRVRSSESLRLRLEAPMFRIPAVGQVILHREIIRLLSSLATLIDGGVSVLQALSLAEEAMGYATFRREVRRVRLDVQKGLPIGESISGSHLLGGTLATMVQVGETSGELAKALQRAARYYERNLQHALKRFTTILEPVLIVGLGVVVAFILFSMMLPILDVDLGA